MSRTQNRWTSKNIWSISTSAFRETQTRPKRCSHPVISSRLSIVVPNLNTGTVLFTPVPINRLANKTNQLRLAYICLKDLFFLVFHCRCDPFVRHPFHGYIWLKNNVVRSVQGDVKRSKSCRRLSCHCHELNGQRVCFGAPAPLSARPKGRDVPKKKRLSHFKFFEYGFHCILLA